MHNRHVGRVAKNMPDAQRHVHGIDDLGPDPWDKHLCASGPSRLWIVPSGTPRLRWRRGEEAIFDRLRVPVKGQELEASDVAVKRERCRCMLEARGPKLVSDVDSFHRRDGYRLFLVEHVLRHGHVG